MKKGIFIFVILVLLTNFSYSFTGKEHELFLCSIYEKEDYNHYNYYFMLDTLESKINVYIDDYGKVSREYYLKICHDSSIVFYTEMEGHIRLHIKNGLIRSRTYESGGVEYLVYDKESHLINIRNKANMFTFNWVNDSLVGFQQDEILRGDSLNKVVTSYVTTASPLCHSRKSPELFCRMYYHHRFNEIVFSMLGLYGEWPLSPDSYSIKRECFGVNSLHYIWDTKVYNTYADNGLLLETHSFYKGYDYIQRFDWNIDNINRIFNYIKKEY